jgi:hypothetical protein
MIGLRRFDTRASRPSAVRPRAFLAGGLATLLASCAPTLPPSEAAVYDGTYVGSAYPADPGLPGCSDTKPVTMVVAGGRVKLGDFDGSIEPGGKVQIFFRRDTLGGQFVPGGFQGQVMEGITCIWNMRLPRQ